MFSLAGSGKRLDLQVPVVMGILNCTPDSFYSVSRVQGQADGLRFAAEQIRQGAQILDLGGQSTRPGATAISAAEERERVIPILSAIRKEFPAIFLSIDTYYGEVAQAAVEAGVDMINDVSGGQIDPSIWGVASRTGLPYVLMHMRGTPQNMQQLTEYDKVTEAVKHYLNGSAAKCLEAGIQQLVLDPGIGFAKSIRQNFQLLNELKTITSMNFPVLVGLSRKSMIYKTLEVEPLMALNGTTALHMHALLQGVKILRVHDVRPAWETIRLYQALRGDHF
jgi:dihydropteroate synthase